VAVLLEPSEAKVRTRKAYTVPAVRPVAETTTGVPKVAVPFCSGSHTSVGSSRRLPLTRWPSTSYRCVSADPGWKLNRMLVVDVTVVCTLKRAAVAHPSHPHTVWCVTIHAHTEV
jgi:hypothetical protein